MNRTLFAGDLHAKGDLLPFISNTADREHADRIVPLLGNHDVPYFMQHGSASFARVRAQAPGFKPGAQRRVHRFAVRVPRL